MRCWASATLLRLAPLPDWAFSLFVRSTLGDDVPPPKVLYVDSNQRDRMCDLSELPPKDGNVRLVIVSDTHERHRLVAVPDGDVFLHCGDIFFSSVLSAPSRQRRIWKDFSQWLEELPHREKVLIGGNHDTALFSIRDCQGLPATILDDNSVLLPLSGLRVYGNSYSEGNTHNDAWQMAAPRVSEECRGADIVLSHQFCPALEGAVRKHCCPRVWASGHEHDQHGVRLIASTLYVNAAIMDKNYRPNQPPVVIDLDTQESQ